MSQCDDILKHLKTKGSITPIEALQLYGCFRLAARIKDLREQGNNIYSARVSQNGKEFARYSLVKSERVA